MNKLIAIILVLIVAIAGVAWYFGIFDEYITPITEPNDFSGSWKSTFEVEYADGTTAIIDSGTDLLTIMYGGYEVSEFKHYIGINPTNVEDNTYSAIHLNIPQTSILSKYSIIDDSGTYHVTDADILFSKCDSTDSIDGIYTFDIDAGAQCVGRQRIAIGLYEGLLFPEGDIYTLVFEISGDFSYDIDSLGVTNEILLPLTTVSVTFESVTPTTATIVNIKWDSNVAPG